MRRTLLWVAGWWSLLAGLTLFWVSVWEGAPEGLGSTMARQLGLLLQWLAR
ncbi:MAG: hypothetical protein RLZZ142_2692 [Verrucomicrobiota bacterium]